MEIKKCTKCGAFITTPADVCESCATKANYSMTLLKTYFEETPSFDSISSVSAATGVSPEYVERYINENNYYNSEISTNTFSSIQY